MAFFDTRPAYKILEDEDKPLETVDKVVIAGFATLFACFAISVGQAASSPLNDFVNRRPLAEEAFRNNGFEIVGTQSSEGTKPAAISQTYSDCYTLKKTPDNGTLYTGCSTISVDKDPSVKITLQSLLP